MKALDGGNIETSDADGGVTITIADDMTDFNIINNGGTSNMGVVLGDCAITGSGLTLLGDMTVSFGLSEFEQTVGFSDEGVQIYTEERF